jgi:hypothetical protein
MCLLVVAAAGCASHHTSPDVISAGQIDIQLPPGWKVTHNGAQAPPTAAASAVAAGTGTASPTTAASAIPLAKANPITAFFQATNSFTGCLKGLGVKFIGAPDPKNPSSPANDPTYLKNLSTCAAQSGIVQALKDFQTSQNNLTPAQIQQQNKGYLAWRQCMIGRGWTIPEPKPDAQGRLFSFSPTGGGGPQLTPPAGQDLLTSSDIRDCAAQVTPASGTAGS